MKKKYTKTHFKLCFLMAMIFTIIHFLTGCFSFWQERIEVPTIVETVVLSEAMCAPVLIIISWYMCFERYIYLRGESSKPEEKEVIQRQVYRGTIYLIISGICLFVSALAAVSFVIKYGKYYEILYGYHLIILAVIIFWLVCLIRSISHVRKKEVMNEAEKKKVKIFRIIVVIFIFVSLICLIFAMSESDSYAFFQYLIRDME